jgi:hypothetical protein
MITKSQRISLKSGLNGDFNNLISYVPPSVSRSNSFIDNKYNNYNNNNEDDNQSIISDLTTDDIFDKIENVNSFFHQSSLKLSSNNSISTTNSQSTTNSPRVGRDKIQKALKARRESTNISLQMACFSGDLVIVNKYLADDPGIYLSINIYISINIYSLILIYIYFN